MQFGAVIFVYSTATICFWPFNFVYCETLMDVNIHIDTQNTLSLGNKKIVTCEIKPPRILNSSLPPVFPKIKSENAQNLGVWMPDGPYHVRFLVD